MMTTSTLPQPLANATPHRAPQPSRAAARAAAAPRGAGVVPRCGNVLTQADLLMKAPLSPVLALFPRELRAGMDPAEVTMGLLWLDNLVGSSFKPASSFKHAAASPKRLPPPGGCSRASSAFCNKRARTELHQGTPAATTMGRLVAAQQGSRPPPAPGQVQVQKPIQDAQQPASPTHIPLFWDGGGAGPRFSLTEKPQLQVSSNAPQRQWSPPIASAVPVGVGDGCGPSGFLYAISAVAVAAAK